MPEGEMQAKIDALTALVDKLIASRAEEADKTAALIKEIEEKNAKKLHTMEMRLTDTKGHSIYAENAIEVKSIKDELPDKTALGDLPKFGGNDNPLIHIRAFKGQMSIKGIKKELWPVIFPHSLEAAAQVWFYSLDPRQVPTWEEITVAFTTRYSDNMDAQASVRTLECLAQKDNEGFSEYLTRWKSVASQLPTKPHENELIPKFINNLKPVYQAHLRYSYIENFRQLSTVGTKIEDDLRAGTMSKYVGRGYQGSSSKSPVQWAKNDDTNAVNVLDVLAVPAKDTSTNKKERRVYTPMQMTYAEAFKRLNKKKLLEPIGPTEDTPVAERPSWWDAKEYCLYHRGKGHDTEKCFRLKNKIQDMIESGELPVPSRANGAN